MKHTEKAYDIEDSWGSHFLFLHPQDLETPPKTLI